MRSSLPRSRVPFDRTEGLPHTLSAPTHGCGKATPSSPALAAVARLTAELTHRGVEFCSWKSNAHLDAALAGETDLDLLVEREHASAFRAVLANHDIKPLGHPPGPAAPGVEHYLGLDASSGRLFHLHVHYQLVLGQKHVKNYRLPIERAILAATEVRAGMPVPAPEHELAILATRVLVKYRLRDVVKDVLHIRTPGIAPDFRAEIDWLLRRTTPARAVEVAEELGALPTAVFAEFLEVVSSSQRAAYKTWKLRRRTRRAVRPFARYGSLRAAQLYASGELRRRTRLRRRPPDLRMKPASGAVTVAFVGADGAGKSTATQAVARWLGWKVATRTHYLGSKPPSRRSRGLYIMFRALRRSHRTALARGAPSTVAARPLALARDVALAAHHLSIGGDRARRYARACRDAADGCVVLYDRFPLSASSENPNHLLLDGPQIAVTTSRANGPSRPVRALARAEERLYRRFRPPDQLVFLHVDPDIASVRKPDHEPEVIAAKCRAVRELEQLAKSRGDSAVSALDANRPLAEVLVDLKKEVWRVL